MNWIDTNVWRYIWYLCWSQSLGGPRKFWSENSQTNSGCFGCQLITVTLVITFFFLFSFLMLFCINIDYHSRFHHCCQSEFTWPFTSDHSLQTLQHISLHFVQHCNIKIVSCGHIFLWMLYCCEEKRKTFELKCCYRLFIPCFPLLDMLIYIVLQVWTRILL